MNRYLLTDFNAENWKGIDIESVITSLEKLNEKTNRLGVLFGELGNPNNFEITLNNVSHRIQNITFEDNKIYGDINILNTEKGKYLKENVDLENLKFGIRGEGLRGGDKITFKNIFTWDILED